MTHMLLVGQGSQIRAPIGSGFLKTLTIGSGNRNDLVARPLELWSQDDRDKYPPKDRPATEQMRQNTSKLGSRTPKNHYVTEQMEQKYPQKSRHATEQVNPKPEELSPHGDYQAGTQDGRDKACKNAEE